MLSFNLKVINKRRKNKIIMFRSDDGAQVEDETQLKSMVNAFYR